MGVINTLKEIAYAVEYALFLAKSKK